MSLQRAPISSDAITPVEPLPLSASELPPSPETPTVGALLGELATQTGRLIRQEARLASTEMSQKVKSASSSIATVLTGGAVAHAGFIATLFGIVLALGAFVPMWISALVLGVLATVVGMMLVVGGLKALRTLDPVPRRTAETLKADKDFLKEQLP